MSACSDKFKRFHLQRDIDETGVSGTGLVAEGVQFRDGVAVMRWCVNPARSTTVYASTEELLNIPTATTARPASPGRTDQPGLSARRSLHQACPTGG